MKSSLITFLISFWILISLSGQSQWKIVNEGINLSYTTVDFISHDTGWVAGSQGIFQTTNGSKNWMLLNGSMNFEIIDFYDESIGWAIVEGKSVLKTLDGGLHWSLRKRVNDGIIELHALTKDTVYAIGESSIFKTVDGGSSWEDRTPSDGSYFSSACFINTDTGFVIGFFKDVIHRTFDGGETWKLIEMPDFNEIENLRILNDSLGYFWGRKLIDPTNFICKTSDLFETWTVISETDLPIRSVHFFDDDVAIADIADHQKKEYRLVKSYDGGFTWTNIDSFIHLVFNREMFAPRSMNFIEDIGYIFGVPGVIMKSVDQGNTWSCINISQGLHDVQFIDRDKGFILGGGKTLHFDYGQLFKTKDGGKTWQLIFFDERNFYSSVDFAVELKGFITGSGALWTSTDGGYSWIENTIRDVENIFLDAGNIFFLNDSTGWLTESGEVFQTHNQGEDWNLFTAGSEFSDLEALHSIYFIDEKTGWMLSELNMGNSEYRNVILKYTEEHGWSKIYSPYDLPLDKISFINHDIGWISGGYNNTDDLCPLFLRSEDGGENWTSVWPLNSLIADFYFENKDHGWAIGEDHKEGSFILETFDSGFHWEVVMDSLSERLNALHFADGFGWAVGDGGLILKYEMLHTTNQERTSIRNEEHILNYPNPFHSNTTIGYQLQATTDVELSIYDLSGRKIATLLNEPQAAGRHDVEWNASDMQPGMYFCELKTASGRQVIKMILID